MSSLAGMFTSVIDSCFGLGCLVALWSLDYSDFHFLISLIIIACFVFLLVVYRLLIVVGSLREIHMSITGNPNDYAVEVASDAWFGSLLWPGAVGLVVGGPVGLAAGVAVCGIMAYDQLYYNTHLTLGVDN